MDILLDSQKNTKNRLVVLISGSGTNLQAIIDACACQQINGYISRVISNTRSAYGIVRAEKVGIPITIHPLLPYKKKEEANLAGIEIARYKYDKDLSDIIIKEDPALVICAGWMHILSNACLDPLEKCGIKLINLHPALPATFDGMYAIERAYKAFCEGKIMKTGVMVHQVIEKIDRGEPIIVKEVPMLSNETFCQFEERMHKIEHEVIIEAILIILNSTNK
ncbi:phosphoribosylglycinamide formyltransferase [Pneumocystis murina B123]|uniref:Phosphoribosylglycinamide formyltransferase n=1 Tax=Pneumocystis murina (strain B123) TaxID=1069680 RepID=M7NRA3_PNEMU|nr:phosphoribosylglycinamide formyltransferase [Pneumocystis murina B123]EMR09651.1 phosphoribosylglycinamide formyltransferase [Pneumocystis murina B123]